MTQTQTQEIPERGGREFETAADCTLAEMNAMVVDRYGDRLITRAEFQAAFDKVANTENWKMPIDAVVHLSGGFELYVTKQAVIFFTASIPEIAPMENGFHRVTADGYYVACGA